MSRLFVFFSFEMKAGPVPMYWEGRGSMCVKLGDQKSTAVFQPKIAPSFGVVLKHFQTG